MKVGASDTAGRTSPQVPLPGQRVQAPAKPHPCPPPQVPFIPLPLITPYAPGPLPPSPFLDLGSLFRSQVLWDRSPPPSDCSSLGTEADYCFLEPP